VLWPICFRLRDDLPCSHVSRQLCRRFAPVSKPAFVDESYAFLIVAIPYHPWLLPDGATDLLSENCSR
jgi:hypothetical protein